MGVGAFEGRIWVEDHDYAIVRLNGVARASSAVDVLRPLRLLARESSARRLAARLHLQPGIGAGKRLRYKAETRLWGYDLTAHRQQQEWTNIQVDAPVPVRDSS